MENINSETKSVVNATLCLCHFSLQFYLHFLIEHVVSLWLEIAHNNPHLPNIFNEHFQLCFQIF